jgi:eukaryotic-like serine/threonine-protein kinase
MISEIREKIGKYPIIEEIGRGASSIVYLADDPFNRRQVAIKVANFEGNYSEPEVARYRKLFLNEASLAGKLVHPNIVGVYDAVVDGDMRYLVMEYVPGGSLHKFCTVSNLLPIQQVVMISFKCCRAMGYAFAQGIIHRDLKPANILLSEQDDIKISDFGTAQISHATRTQLQGFIGSPAYMSPEYITDKQPSQQTDIYSLGATMYELLAGRLPFSAQSAVGVINKILHEAPVRLSELRPEIPERLVKLVEKAMNRDPAARYQTWYDMAKDLADSFNSLSKLSSEINNTEKFNKLRGLKFFQSFKDSDLWEVLRCGTWENRAAQADLLREGDIGHFFYVIVEGQVEVSRDGRILNGLAQGDCFGEMSYLNRAQLHRTATMTSRTAVQLLKIESAQLEQVSESCQLQFTKVFLRALVERLSWTDEALSRLRA